MITGRRQITPSLVSDPYMKVTRPVRLLDRATVRRAHELTVEQSAYLVDGVATVVGQGERSDVHSGTQSDRRCAGEPFMVVPDECCVQVFQQRVDQPCDVLGRHDEDGPVAGVLERTGPVSWVLQSNEPPPT
jgi:hypothetical protein